jgi:hypothetical protein
LICSEMSLLIVIVVAVILDVVPIFLLVWI